MPALTPCLGDKLHETQTVFVQGKAILVVTVLYKFILDTFVIGR